jgi:hypothetical protein
MKIARMIIGTGIVVIIFGLIFQFQGRGIVGPESSFMYYNKDWIYYGIETILAGIIMCGIGALMHMRTRSHVR